MNSTTKDLHLSVVDQSVYRQYIRHLHIFPFPDFAYVDEALHALRTGLSSTLRQYPFLAGTLKVPDPSTGLLKATYPNPISPDYGDVMLTASFALAANSKFDYCALEEAGFPPAMLPAYAFCPLELRNHAGLDDPYAETSAGAAKGYRIPIMCAQATFIPGGLVLSVYAHHSVVDGGAMIKVYEVWSDHVKGLQDGSKKTEMLDRMWNCQFSIERRRLDDMADSNTFWPVPHCPELATVLTKKPVIPLHPTPYDVKAKILTFPASYISSLRSSLQSLTPIKISTFTTIAALLWTHITRARSTFLLNAGFTSTTVGTLVNLRTRSGSALSPSYMGNAALYATTDLPIATMTTHDSPSTPRHLLPVALALATTLKSVSAPWLSRRVQYLQPIPDPSTVTNAFTYVNGPYLIINSWQFQGADCEWGIPGTTDSKPSAIRKPSCLSEGGVRILPRRSDGERGYEVLVCLEEGEMRKLVESLGEEGGLGRVVDG
jgi:hypothetical protein